MKLPAQVRARPREAAVVQGKRVGSTKHNELFAESMRLKSTTGMDFDQAAIIRCELRLDGLEERLPLKFDDPAFRCQVLGVRD